MSEPLSRHQVLLFKGDFEKLGEYYIRRSASDVVRTLVRKHLNALEQIKRKEREDVGRNPE